MAERELVYVVRGKRNLANDGWIEQNFRYLNGRRVRGYGPKPARWVVRARTS